MFSPISHRETVYGWLYLAVQVFLLPTFLQWGNGMLPTPFSEAELNFLFFGINFLAIVIIFHRFLSKSAKNLFQHPALFLQAVVLGLAAYFACTYVFNSLISWFRPGFVNLNDQGIASMARSGRFLMVVGTVILVPPVEECLYRGLIFRNLYQKSAWLAYTLSMLAFAAIHLLGFVGSLSPMDLLISLIQYLPAGLCLAWAYTKAGTIYAPIVIHALINFWGIHSMR